MTRSAGSITRRPSAFIKQVTGASRVFIFDHLQRRRVTGLQDRVARRAAPAGDPRACRPHRQIRPAAGSRPAARRGRGIAEGPRPGDQLCGARFSARCRTRRSRCATPAPSHPTISCRRIWSTGNGSARPIRCVQPGAPVVLRAGDAARRGAAAEDRRHPDRHPGALHAAHLVHRPDDARPTRVRVKASRSARSSSTRPEARLR